MIESENHPTEIELYSILHTRFNLPSLYPFQELVIRAILEQNGLYGPSYIKENAPPLLVVLPTGSGKSVCFMLPSLLVKGVTVVVYPLISLMNDQKRRVEELGSKVEILRGGQTYLEREAIFARLRAKEVRFIITNAETLALEPVLNELVNIEIDLFVVDEVHTVAQWGQTFRPSLLALSSIVKKIRPKQLLAFTATASKNIITSITQILFSNKKPHIIQGSADRPNIYYKSHPTLSIIHDLEMLIKESIEFPALIFCASRKRCESYTKILREREITNPIAFYHAGMEKERREEVEKWFFNSDEAILVATSAYGMGVDKKNIRTVIHADPSNDVESFLQESGRAGRDGKFSLSIMLVKRSLFSTQNRLIDIYTQSTKCRREALLAQLGEQNTTCSGCDVCDSNLLNSCDGEREILQLIRYYPLRFTTLTASKTLLGVPQNSLHLFNPLFGVLKEWKLSDIQQAVREIIGASLLKEALFPLVKGKLYRKSLLIVKLLRRDKKNE